MHFAFLGRIKNGIPKIITKSLYNTSQYTQISNLCK